MDNEIDVLDKLAEKRKKALEAKDKVINFNLLFLILASFDGLYPPASEASREVENFDCRKKHPPTRILCQKFVCLSVCLSVCKIFDLKYH